MIGMPERPAPNAPPAPNGVGDRKAPEATAPQDPNDPWVRFASHLDGLLDDLRVLGNVRSDRLRLRLRRALGGAQRAAVFGLATAALAVAGVVVLAIGTLRAFDALFAVRPWLGGLAAGASLILAAAALSIVRSARANRAFVRRLEEKYAARESEPRPDASIP
jgi:hypothetical protein